MKLIAKDNNPIDSINRRPSVSHLPIISIRILVSISGQISLFKLLLMEKTPSASIDESFRYVLILH